MKKLFFPILLLSQVAMSQRTGAEPDRILLRPFVTITDTVQKAYVIECINNHPNCWGGTREVYKGLDSIRIFRTFVRVNDKDILIDKKIEYLTEPKGYFPLIGNF